MGSDQKGKILIFGGTGYLGQYLLKASVSAGHPTYAYVRPIKPNCSDPSKLQLHNQIQSMGVTIFQGELDEHEKLVWVVGQVDVVISALPVPQHLDQLNIISAMKESGNIKRFVPSEFGNEVDRVRGLPPFQALLDNKKKIRRATEAAGIPYTYVSANSFASYFIDILLHPRQNSHHVTVYGNGQAKVAFTYEEDVAAYTVKAATDERVTNRVIIYRLPRNIMSQLDLISCWEKKTGAKLDKIYVPEHEIISLSQVLPYPDNIPVAILHNIFIKGAQVSFELTEDDLEASKLYPDYNYTTVNDLLDICLVNPPKPKMASF
ncbi:hypothetical protein Acr_09g0003080 [Actinidia rufa]|uniref:NmrA-like domain-containing protein n=1 Tax=Actinidia rufa TaxID=165716 RepID=A0A7J0F579_9ERIC|nr:hypothetical protein Acr_09g0003080 [Actinidia rufa]